MKKDRLTVLIFALGMMWGCEVEDDGKDRQEAKPQEMFKTALQKAIISGMKPGGDLSDELSGLEDYVLRSKKDAEAICRALARLPDTEEEGDDHLSSNLYSLCSLFQKVESAEDPAFAVLSLKGQDELIRIYDLLRKRGNEEDGDDLVFLLKILTMYGSESGAKKVVEAVQAEFEPENYLWSVIFSMIGDDHHHRDFIFGEMRKKLPLGFAGVSLLDGANQAMLGGNLKVHPFDSEGGEEMLKSWIENEDEEKFSYAVSATAALALVTFDGRNELLELARNHLDSLVQMEAAWVAVKLGREWGLSSLVKSCEDPGQSAKAQSYLEELGKGGLIPAKTKEPKFLAQAEFANWLAHPNELGQAPDEMEVVDHRQLKWPTEEVAKDFTIVRYRLRNQSGLKADDVDCGLVGSMTWCFFSYEMNQRPPEDIYAIHCFWEMTHEDLIVESDEMAPGEYDGLLKQWDGSKLEGAVIEDVADLSPKLNYPSRLVAVAKATMNEVEGWAILDGARSKWYVKSDFPDETNGKQVLMIHVGSGLLKFEKEPDRGEFLKPDEAGPDAETFVAAYEKLIAEVEGASLKEVPKLLGGSTPLKRHFEKYVESLAEVSGQSQSESMLLAYERFLKIVEKCDDSQKKDLYDCFTLIGENFEHYVDALISVKRNDEVRPLIARFEPYWDHNLGRGLIGEAAFKVGDFDFAETHLVSVRENMEEWGRSKMMDLLAEIWLKKGKGKEARELLINCMKQLREEFEESEYASDRKTHAKDFQVRRMTFLRLFPGEEDRVEQSGLPEKIGAE